MQTTPTAAPTTAVRGRHLPALDGLRALAVLSVMAYHLGWRGMSGGFLGVDLFFVLSGFLITSLLVEERRTTGRIAFGSFWGRRARRLLPAALAMLVGVSIAIVVLQRTATGVGEASVDHVAFLGDGIATLLYVANWHAIVTHQSYFQAFLAASPIKHTWSLAIEEQFYLVWPLVVALLLRARSWRRSGVAVTVLLAVASSALMAGLYLSGASPSALYYDTFTRLFDLAGGAALAFALAMRPTVTPSVQRRLDVAGVVAASALGLAWWKAGVGGIDGLPRRSMFEGGFLVCTVLAVVVVAAVRGEDARGIAVVLRWRPLVWIGTISYGLYLWHWPVDVLATPGRVGVADWRLDVVKIALAFALATISFSLLERPLRRARYPRWSVPILVPAGMAVAALAILLASIYAVIPVGPTPPTAPVLPDAYGIVTGSGVWQGTPRPLTHPLDHAHPLSVLVVGDSVMYSGEIPIARGLFSTGEGIAYEKAFPGWGLTTERTWPSQITSMLAKRHPDLVIGMWGWDNAVAHDHPAAYEALLQHFVDVATTGPNAARAVLFLEYPKTGGLGWASGSAASKVLGLTGGIEAFQRIARSVVAHSGGRAAYLDTAGSVLYFGNYTSWLAPSDDQGAPQSRWVRVRSVDTIHLCQPGAVDEAAAVLADLHELYGLPAPTGNWYTGRWVRDPRYHGGLINCPNDHPPA